MSETKATAIPDWARQIPVEQIPSVIVYLAARLLAERDVHNPDHDSGNGRRADKLLNASELAERLNLPETWVRNQERLGRIPSIRAGKYVRFRLGDVERALSKRKRLEVSKSRSVLA
jgi:hypothetical protein